MSHSFSDFPDGILYDKRIENAYKGHRKSLGKIWDDSVRGDFETMCLATQLVLRLYEPSASSNGILFKTLEWMSDYCMSLPRYMRSYEISKYPAQLTYIDGTYCIYAVIGYVAVCNVKKVSLFELGRRIFDDGECFEKIVKPVYNRFDNLTNMVYNKNIVERLDGRY